MIERSADGDVAVLRLAHGRVNAVDVELCEAVTAQFRALVTDPAHAAVGDAAPRTLVLGRRTYPVDEAQAFGLVDEIRPADDPLAAAVDRARAFAAAVPPDTFAVTRAQLRRDARERMDRYADEADPVEPPTRDAGEDRRDQRVPDPATGHRRPDRAARRVDATYELGAP